jgi:hypothetical protein
VLQKKRKKKKKKNQLRALQKAGFLAVWSCYLLVGRVKKEKEKEKKKIRGKKKPKPLRESETRKIGKRRKVEAFWRRVKEGRIGCPRI